MADNFVIEWDKPSERIYETGVDRGVLYPMTSSGTYGDGVAWNGLTAINENPSGGEPQALYADNMKYLELISVEEFEATIEAFTYPVEFEECDGSAELAIGVMIGQQPRKPFGLAYRTLIGNATSGNDHGYKLHLIYGALAAPADKNYETINDTPDAINFSWGITTTPVAVTGFKPTASLTINSTKIDAEDLAELEEILYGKPAASQGGTAVAPRLPLPDEILTIITPVTSP